MALDRCKPFLVCLVAMLAWAAPAFAGKSVTVLVKVKILAAPPSFNIPLPKVGTSGAVTYGTVPFQLSTPGQTSSTSTTVETRGPAASVLFMPADASPASPLVVGNGPLRLSSASAAGVITSVPHFEASGGAQTTVVTSFAAGP